jgi:uncharacterized protein (DUF924 family)
MDEARKVRDFWFGKLPLSAEQLTERMRLWFGTGRTQEQRDAWDEAIRTQFEPLVKRALAGELASWADSPKRRLSLILLLDQFPRHIYRGSPRSYAGDEQALALALTGMQSGADAALSPPERLFFYMPLQHSEARDVQDESVAAYRRLLMESPESMKTQMASALDYAERHREVIERFGRFPHRNRVLGRPSTPEEIAYLRSGGEDFSRPAN